MQEPITFLHAADLHLDSPFRGLSHLPQSIFQDIHHSTFKALDNLIQLAISTPVDFVVLVGDLFDSEKQTLQSQTKLRQAFQQLNEAQIPVYVSYGNHDYLEGNKHRLTFPENTHIFNSEDVSSFTFHKNATTVHISGFSYETRRLEVEKAIEFPVKNQQNDYHIGLYHGSVNGNIEHDTYAPFRITQLNEKNYDYWALGHIHQRAVLQESPPIIYPGNIQGRHRKESGEKGCYIVTLDGNTSTRQFHPLATIEFAEKTINLNTFSTIDQLAQHSSEMLAQLAQDKLLLTIHFETTELEKIYLEEAGLLEQLVDSLNEQYASNETWQYIYRYKFNCLEQFTTQYPEPFQKEMFGAATLDQVDLAVKELQKNQQLKSILELDKSDILKEAKQNIQRTFS